MNSKNPESTVPTTWATVAGILILSVALSSPARADEILKPDVGVPEPFLLSLGTGAKHYLISMLDESKNATRYHLIVHRLKGQSGVGEDKEISDALKKFVDKAALREGEISSSYLEALTTSLRTIGQRGGEPGIDYLRSWAKGDGIAAKVRCYLPKGTDARTRYALMESALRGLGLSGRQRALNLLREVKVNPPKVQYQTSFMKSLDEAIWVNEQVRAEGIEGYYKAKQAGRRKRDKDPIK